MEENNIIPLKLPNCIGCQGPNPDIVAIDPHYCISCVEGQSKTTTTISPPTWNAAA